MWGKIHDLCAVRELAEETGYQAGRWQKLTEFYMSPGILNERMHVYLATELQPGSAHREATEEIDNALVPWSEALELIRRGEIDDGKRSRPYCWFSSSIPRLLPQTALLSLVSVFAIQRAGLPAEDDHCG